MPYLFIFSQTSGSDSSTAPSPSRFHNLRHSWIIYECVPQIPLRSFSCLFHAPFQAPATPCETFTQKCVCLMPLLLHLLFLFLPAFPLFQTYYTFKLKGQFAFCHLNCKKTSTIDIGLKESASTDRDYTSRRKLGGGRERAGEVDPETRLDEKRQKLSCLSHSYKSLEPGSTSPFRISPLESHL